MIGAAGTTSHGRDGQLHRPWNRKSRAAWWGVLCIHNMITGSNSCKKLVYIHGLPILHPLKIFNDALNLSQRMSIITFLSSTEKQFTVDRNFYF